MILRRGFFFIGATLAYFVIERWLNLLSDILPNITVYLNPVDFVVFGIAGIGIFLLIKERDEPTREERVHHRDKLIQIYKRIADIYIKEEDGNYVFSYPLEFQNLHPLEMYDFMQRHPNADRTTKKYFHLHEKEFKYYDLAMKHLEKYKDVNKNWKKLQELLDEYNCMTKLEDVLEKKIKEQMRLNYPDFTDKRNSSENINWYSIHEIKNCLIEIIQFNDRRQEKHDFSYIITDKIGGDLWCIRIKDPNISPQIASNSKEKLNLDKYRKILFQISQDKDVLDSFKNTNEKFEELWNEMRLFKKELKAVITRLEAGEMIKGKCKIGY